MDLEAGLKEHPGTMQPLTYRGWGKLQVLSNGLGFPIFEILQHEDDSGRIRKLIEGFHQAGAQLLLLHQGVGLGGHLPLRKMLRLQVVAVGIKGTERQGF